MKGRTLALNFSYLHLILVHCKGQVQRLAHFDCEYLTNDDRHEEYYHCNQIESHIWTFDLHFYI